MTTTVGYFCSPKTSPLLRLVTHSFRSTSAHQSFGPLSTFSRDDSLLLAGVSLSLDGCLASVIAVPLVPKNCCANHRLFSNTSDPSTLEAELSRPDMSSFFTRAKEVPETSIKDLDKNDDEAEAERVKKEEQKRRDEDAENLRKEKEVHDKIGPPPEKPLPGDCCGNGCSPCIWDTYWGELEDYKKLRKSVEESE